MMRLIPALLLATAGISANATSNSRQPFAFLEGTGTEGDPWLIKTADDFRWFASVTQAQADVTEGKFFKLTSDLRFNDKVLTDSGELIADTANLEKWLPVGIYDWYNSSHAFKGEFDGDGHTISGVYFNNPQAEGTGIFAYVYNGIVKNLTVADSYFSSKAECGALVGMVRGGSSKSDYCEISNCVSYATVHGTGNTHSTGGVVGSVNGYNQSAAAVNCINYGNVTSLSVANEYDERWNCSLGGVAGVVSGGMMSGCSNHGYVEMKEWSNCGGVVGAISQGSSVTECENYGTVVNSYSKGADIGGVVGSNSAWVSYCTNHGSVINGAPGDCLGGVVGSSYWKSSIANCSNLGNLEIIYNETNAGGICGYAYANNSYPNYGNEINIYDCQNSGRIQSQANANIGGIAGYSHYTNLTRCTNKGTLIQHSEQNIGGITSSLEYHSSITECRNEGEVSGAGNVGGIVGEAIGSVKSCVNHGCITGLEGQKDYSATAGISGYHGNGSMQNCYNTGDISGYNYSGGIVGRTSYKYSAIYNCYNSGNVESYRDYSTGGIGGYVICPIMNCYNVGNVTNIAGGNIGGIVATFSGSEIRNCYNAATVLSRGEGQFAGSVLGWVNENTYSATTDNCYTLDGCLDAEGHISLDTHWSNRKGPEIISKEYLASQEFLNVLDKQLQYWEPRKNFTLGLYRPMIMPLNEGNLPGYIDAVTLRGDSVRVDFGIPFGNEVVTCKSGELMRYGYNCIDSVENAVRKMMLWEGSDYTLPQDVKALNLKMKLSMPENGGPAYRSAVLPFDVDNLSLGAKIGTFSKITGESAVFDACDTATHSTPFLIATDGKDVDIDIDDCALYAAETMTTPESGLVGTYVNRMLDTANGYSYYSLGVNGEWQKILSDCEVNPFTAVLMLTGNHQEMTFATVLSDSSSVDLNTDDDNLQLPVYSVTGLFIGKMSQKDVLNLKPGIYVWGHKKIIVTK